MASNLSASPIVQVLSTSLSSTQPNPELVLTELALLGMLQLVQFDLKLYGSCEDFELAPSMGT